MSVKTVDVAIVLDTNHMALALNLSGNVNNVKCFETVLPENIRASNFSSAYALSSEIITAPLHNGFVAQKTECFTQNVFVFEVFANPYIYEYFDRNLGIRFFYHIAQYGYHKVDFELRDKAIAIDWQGASLIMGAPRWVPFRDLLVFPWLRHQHRHGLKYLVDQQIIRL